MPMSAEYEFDTRIRRWSWTPMTDPYQSELETVAAQLQTTLGEVLFALAYNKFCAPSSEESVEDWIKKGTTHITVATTMSTPGGSHSEVEIPEILEQLRKRYPHIALHYVWPFDKDLITGTLVTQIKRF